MIDIYATGGSFLGVRIPYKVMLDLMKDDFVKDTEFIEFEFENGYKGAVRKSCINGFCDSEDIEEV